MSLTFSDPCDQIVAALFVCDENLGDLKKNANNEHFKRKYADLGATCEAIDPGLKAGKLLVIQVPLTAPDGAIGVATTLLHISGQWVKPDPLFLPLQKADPQGAGSAITYARRYALAAFFGLAPVDDDANAASGHGGKTGGTSEDKGGKKNDRGIDPNALLIAAVEKGVIPQPDRLMFKEWARTKVPACKNLADNAPLTPAQLAACEKALAAIKPPLRSVPNGSGAGVAQVPHGSESQTENETALARQRIALRTSIVALCRTLELSDDDRHAAEKKHGILGLRDEVLHQHPVARLEALRDDLTARIERAEEDAALEEIPY